MFYFTSLFENFSKNLQLLLDRGLVKTKSSPMIISSKLGSPLGSGLRSGLGLGSARARDYVLGFVRPRIGSGNCSRLAKLGARLGTRLFSARSDSGRVSGLALFSSVPKLQSSFGVGVENSGLKKTARVENLEVNV